MTAPALFRGLALRGCGLVRGACCCVPVLIPVLTGVLCTGRESQSDEYKKYKSELFHGHVFLKLIMLLWHNKHANDEKKP